MEATTQTTSRPRKAGSTSEAAQPVAIGLCSTCNSAAHCVFRKKRGFDAVFCEMFDDYATVGNGDPDSGSSLQDVTATHDSPHQTGSLGLCANCENRHSCTLARPEGGVWHCEEYL